MLQVIDVRLQFGGRVLFDNVNIKFTKGNCYGVIGANGAGKSTFLKILSKELEPNKGEVVKDKTDRMSVLTQNQNEYDGYSILDTVLMGHKRLYDISKEKDALYNKPDFSEQDGIKAAELENEFAELNGYSAESEAENLLQSIGIKDDPQTLMKSLDGKKKVKVLLAKAVFFNPDILILDEPTNNLDAKSVIWLENFLLNFENTVIIVSHNRHFLNKVCTHICDVDFSKINLYFGNYDFWYETSQLILRQSKETNKKLESRMQELQEFIRRFAANASKSRQATSRKKELEKITLDDIKPSSRKYPYIDFKLEREIGNDILFVENLTKKGYFENLSFTVNKGEKIAFLSDKSQSITMLFDILMGIEKPDSGKFKWGLTIIPTYLPINNKEFFENCKLSLVDWIRQYSKEKDETYLRGWLGRMLFSGEEALKRAEVLSGGEKVRCMLSRMMLMGGNFLLMDEPTNNLDLESITALNKGMTNFTGNILFTTHDHELIQTAANRIIVINNTKTFDRQISYDDYLELAQ